MFPKLSDLINYLFGSNINLPVQTYGFFLALGFVCGGFILRAELRRKEKEGLLHARIVSTQPNKPASWLEFTGGLLFSTLIGWKFFGIILDYHIFAIDPQKYILSTKGSYTALILIPVITTCYHLFTLYRERKYNDSAEKEVLIHPWQNTWNIMFVAIVSALAGSKLFDILDNFNQFLNHPVRSLLSFSGFAFYGGFIVTLIVLLFYMRMIRLNWKHVIDCSAPVIMIGYAIGRLGCHLSGDGCWGIVNTMAQPHLLAWLPGWFWAWDFPHNVASQGVNIAGCIGPHCRQLAQPVFPTSLYESIISFASFGFIWFMRARVKAPVVLFGLFMVLNGTERFFIEKIRINHKYNLLGMHVSQAEVISALLIILGVAAIIFFHKRHQAEIRKQEFYSSTTGLTNYAENNTKL